MRLINRKKVKEIVKEHKKQCTNEYFDQLEFRVRQLILKSIANARHFKRLKASELM